MKVSKIETLFTFFNREKSDGTSNQYFKDRTESFDDYYPCVKKRMYNSHVYNWIQFFVSMYNDTTLERIISIE